MKIFSILVLAAAVACSLALPTAFVTSRAIEGGGILRQINNVNDDGSFTFGYESADGSFRVENRDAGGLVRGRYGYIDPFGQQQEFEYVAGALGGQSLGFQSRSALLPESVLGGPFPIVRSSPIQRALDFQYSSVDENRDGFPDIGSLVATRAPTALYNSPGVRLVDTPIPTRQVVDYSQDGSVLRATPTAVFPQQTEIVRFAQPATQVRLVEAPALPVLAPALPVLESPQRQIVQIAEPASFVTVEQPTLLRTNTGGQLDAFLRGLQFSNAQNGAFNQPAVQVVQQGDPFSVIDAFRGFTQII